DRAHRSRTDRRAHHAEVQALTERAERVGWTAIARSKGVAGKPTRVLAAGRPLVLFRASDGIHCLADICPHRSAPLSKGRVVDGAIECPYHGWRFAGSGRCTGMPGLIGELPRALVPSYPVVEKDGLVFFALDREDTEPYTTVLSGKDTVSAIVESRVRSTLAE